MDHRLSGEFDDQYYDEFVEGWSQLLDALKKHVEQ